MLKSLKIVNKYEEVLEILKKYFPKNCYPLICDSKELEKWNKAKQWLESNIDEAEELEIIKQDLEKYSNVMKLLKNLFDGIRLDCEDVYDGNTYCYSSYIMEDLDYNTFEISNELFNILDDLRNLVGDNHD